MLAKEPRDLELILSNYVRTNYEDKFNKQHIPLALKYVMVNFSKKIIQCNMLSFHQDLKFFQSLSTKLPNIRAVELLFRASEHSYSKQSFHELCDNQGPTITIIQSEYGNIFGGYVANIDRV